jgi:protein involved in polysaccharide export with SLBB domain
MLWAARIRANGEREQVMGVRSLQDPGRSGKQVPPALRVGRRHVELKFDITGRAGFLAWPWIALWLMFSLVLICSPQIALGEEPPISVGDVLRIDLPGEDSLNKEFEVDRRGNVRLPEVGTLAVADLTVEQAREKVREALSLVIRDLDRLSVTLAERRLLVKVLGYVEKPGTVILYEDGTIQDAIEQAGGLRSGAQLDRMQVRRGEEVIGFDYKQYLDTGELDLLPDLRPSDTVFVPASPMVGNVEVDFDAANLAGSGDAAEDRSAVKVFGEVNGPGSFSYKEGATVVDLLMRAGGVTRYAGVEQIRVITEGEPRLFDLKAYLDTGDRSLMPALRPGATLFVPKEEEEIKAGANTVYVMGEVFKPGAFEGKPGARFMDVLANAGGPTRFAESRQIRVLRAGGKVERFDLQAYTEGRGAVAAPEIHPGDAIFVPEKTDINEKSWLKVAPERAVHIMGAVNRPGRYEWSDEMSLVDLLAHAGGPKERANTSGIQIVLPEGDGRALEFDLERFLKEGGRTRLPRIIAGATVMVPELPLDPTDNKAQWLRQAPEDSIYVFGQVGAPGRYAFNSAMNFLDILSAADGPNTDADLRNVRINHRNGGKTHVSKLNLARYFETGDDSLLPRVRPGDAIYIPSKDRDWLEESPETTVRVLGAVKNPGRYRFADNMTLLDLLAQAGGPTNSAYVDRITVVNLSCCKDQARMFDLEEFSRKPNFSRLPVVRVGDTVYVPDKSDSVWSQVRDGLTDIFRIVSIVALIAAL